MPYENLAKPTTAKYAYVNHSLLLQIVCMNFFSHCLLLMYGQLQMDIVPADTHYHLTIILKRKVCFKRPYGCLKMIGTVHFLIKRYCSIHFSYFNSYVLRILSFEYTF